HCIQKSGVGTRSQLSELNNERFQHGSLHNGAGLDHALRYNHINPYNGRNLEDKHCIQQQQSCSYTNHCSRTGTVWVNTEYKSKDRAQWILGEFRKSSCIFLLSFSAFPMDRQLCHLTLESFSCNNQEVDMQWTNWTDALTLLKKKIVLPDFVLSNYSTVLEHVMTFVFSRRYEWYIFQAYIPTYFTIFIR
ncbi:unnamed protein product, partial [Cylicostephanus goldi]